MTGVTVKALAVLITSILVFPAHAEDVQVIGLFKDRALLSIDGSQRLLRSGEASPEGIRLISADSDGAVLEVNGVQSRHALGGRAGGRMAAPVQAEMRLLADAQGMFQATGSINGRLVKLLVDTGANAVAMNSGQARQLGVDFRLHGKPTQVTTASGVEMAWQLKLDNVKLGGIQLRNVDAVVLEGAFPHTILLGMSFLGQLHMQREGTLLLLRQKY